MQFSKSSCERIDRAVRRVEGLAPIGSGGAYIGAKDEGGSAAGYSGPFAVVAGSGSSYAILGYNGTTRNFHAYINIGMSQIELPDGSVSGSGDVYLSITNNGTTYLVTVSCGTMPAQTASTYYHPIAYINSDGSVVQMQYGQINLPGRYF